MKAMSDTRRTILFILLGAAGGYLFLHPYTMAVYGLHGASGTASGERGVGGVFSAVVTAFRPEMLPMGVPFALLGGIAGLFSALWLSGRMRRFEAEKRLLAAETVRQLTVTLAHYLLNAVQGIGGFAGSIVRKEMNEDLKRRAGMIREEARKIEAVVRSLQSLESVASERYVESAEAMMIDIRKEIEETLRNMGAT